MNNDSIINPSDVLNITKPFVSKNNNKALLLFFFDFLVYGILLFATVTIDNLLLKSISAIVTGLFIAFLFIVGHDCCHRSYTSNKKLNSLLGIISFLPSFHNFKLWELGHNRTHHAFTNLKSKDYVYTPLSPDEYKGLNAISKIKYRLYRSILGHLFYYMNEIWFKKMIIPNKSIPNLNPKGGYWEYSLYLLIYLVVMIGGIAAISVLTGKAIGLSILFALVIPFLVWNWIMGFAIYQHHTNKLTKWFDNHEEWEYWEIQVGHSVHIQFPKPINLLLHNIMEHTAHHSNMNIPLYNLEAAQDAITEKFSDKMNIVHWDFAFYIDSIRSCKLYDYQTHEWLSFKESKNR